jgi:hypothetical protein
MGSCEVFQKEPLDAVDEEKVWQDEKLATLYLNNLYSLVMPTFSATVTSSYSDESPGGGTYMYDNLTAESITDFSKDTYGKIRRINLMIHKLQTSVLPEEVKTKLKGQAIFLRAFAYWNLVKLYGGVPMILNPQDLVVGGGVSPALYVKRNKTKECIEIIAADLDTAFQCLPAKWESEDYGRITRGAAISLKGRILLYWASPQFNPQNKIERWQWAYDVNKMALDTLKKDGFGLLPSFKSLFNDCKEVHKIEEFQEAILVRVYNTADFYHAFDKSVRPVYESKSGGGSNPPTWQLVKAFPMADGNPIDSAGKPKEITSKLIYYPDRFWVNRDPRLEFTVAYNSCYWPLSGQSNYRLWTYYYYKDTTLVSVETNERNAGLLYTQTGFYCKKFINPTIFRSQVDLIGTDWIELRYAEVLLNFAECANELDNKTLEVRNALNQIRNGRTDVKVGMGYIDRHINDRNIIREVIMTERQVELAFENKRHWDLRRRNMFENDLGPTIKKLNGQRRTGLKVLLNEGRITPQSMILNRDNINFTSTIIYNSYFLMGTEYNIDTQYPIDFPQPKYNFYAIPQTELNQNPNLEQTKEWGGTFDPLEE